MNKSKLVSNQQIYLDCRKLIDVVLDVTPNFPRAYKFTIGNKMHEISVNLISEITAASFAAVLTALGGWEAIKYLINRKSNSRKAEAEADTEFRRDLVEGEDSVEIAGIISLPQMRLYGVEIDTDDNFIRI